MSCYQVIKKSTNRDSCCSASKLFSFKLDLISSTLLGANSQKCESRQFLVLHHCVEGDQSDRVLLMDFPKASGGNAHFPSPQTKIREIVYTLLSLLWVNVERIFIKGQRR